MGIKALCSLKSYWLLGSLILFSGIVSLSQNKPNITTLASVSGHNLEKSFPEQQLRQGNTIKLGKRQLPVAWIQWHSGEALHTGVSDTGAMVYLGLDLLSTKKPPWQPVRWFSSAFSQPRGLNAYLVAPYRYLDITSLARDSDMELVVVDNVLEIKPLPTQIKQVRQRNSSKSSQIELFVDKPTFWQVNREPNEVVLEMVATVEPDLLEKFKPPELTEENEITASEESESEEQPDSISPIIESDGTHTQVRIEVPHGLGVKVRSLPNPNRLIIDIGKNTFTNREITWTPGLVWRQQQVSLENQIFPVVWLEVDPRSPHLKIKPLTNNPEKMAGIEPLVRIARNSPAYAAINGGFFNRNNRLPLGAVRRDNQWLSGPILNRGAIAWNQTNARFARLNLQETLTTIANRELPIILLNSGYVKAGIARYTSAWGNSYQTLIDDEIIISVENGRVVEHLRAGKAGEDSFPIPPNGYLLILRSFDSAAPWLPIGTVLNITSNTEPADFANYPQIVGAGPLLVQNNRIVLDGAKEQFSNNFNRQGAPRSAIGVTRGGMLILAAFHHPPGEKGPTLLQTAQLMQRLGAFNAINLDGGSSTSLYLGGQLINRPGNTAARVNNGIGIFPNEN